MKKITLFVGLLTVSFATKAQTTENYYTFSTSTSTYTELVDPVSINNGVAWDWDDFGPYTSPFTLELFGLEYTEFAFNDDYFMLGDPLNEDNYNLLDPTGTFIMDRGYDDEVSLSPLSYKVEGTEGARILKLQAKNVGLEDEWYYDDTNNLYLNYQVWFYESDNSIEFHYGATNVTASDIPEYMEYWLPSLGAITMDFNGRIAILEGNPTDPTYTEFEAEEDIEYEPTGLNNTISENTVYRFELSPLAIADQHKVTFAVYPNPVNDVLNVQFEEAMEQQAYTIFDMTGRLVTKGTLSYGQQAQINVSTLNNGTYILRMGSTSKKFIKK